MQEKHSEFDLTADVQDGNGGWLGCYSVSLRGKILHVERNIEIRDEQTDVGAQHKVMALARKYVDTYLRG